MYELRRRTTLRTLACGAIALTFTAALSAPARADGPPGGDGWNKDSAAGYAPGEGEGTVVPPGACEFSLDGRAWQRKVRVGPSKLRPEHDGTVRIHVRASAGEGTCTASLASYRTHGPSWKESGEQVFHAWDTTTVAAGTVGTLRTAVPDAGCYAQIDLYRSNVKYDGLLGAEDGWQHGLLPKGPDRPVIRSRLIAAWNGGTRDCTEQQTPAPGSSPSAPAEKSAVPSEAAPASPSAAGDEAPSPSTSATLSVPPSETPANGVAQAAGAPAREQDGALARTGAGAVGPYALAGLILLGAGGGVLALRRRSRTGTG
ncbi:hypothetical protein NPS70_17570 [Streptomyces sp. C10-9-1]|uniref:hypothetical protein n=1 Tax=Streptomyces sp. C10-9-1 TaxID=1859285 RepID=UPI0021129F82|nr:hypothetical protein [Streptomyces sp. C10-9-1]MCQ6554988.1 hypothetical protein [Streptomyces sp. C10-9-1]